MRESRENRPLKSTLFLTVAGALFNSCMSQSGGNSTIDLSNVPNRVAVVAAVLPGQTLDFHPVPISTDFDVAVTLGNGGHYEASELKASESEPLSPPFSFAGGSYPGAGGSCGDHLAPGENCTLVLRFHSDTRGEFSGKLKLGYINGVAKIPINIELKGSTTAALSISNPAALAETTHVFARQALNTGVDLSLTVKNTGILPANRLAASTTQPLASPFSFKGGTYPGQGGDCGATLATDASCTIVVRYAPTASGKHTGKIRLDYDDGRGAGTANTHSDFALQGIGQTGWASGAAPTGPSAHASSSSVWTGTEMLVWGGSHGATCDSDGGAYDPVNDSWRAIATAGAPSGRVRHSAVWDGVGKRMLVWGGMDCSGTAIGTGAIYDAAHDTWTSMSQIGAPSARFGHIAIWDSVRNRMLIWGGAGAGVLTTGLGYSFDPSAGPNGTWTAISDALSNTPVGRYGHTAVSDGTRILIWGGCGAKNAGLSCQTGQELANGAIYNPSTSSWTSISTSSAPSARFMHTAVWTGDRMVIWGGATDPTGTGAALSSVSTGGVYRPPGFNDWSATATVSAPSARRGHLAFWNGSGMLIWGGAADPVTGAILSLTSGWTAMGVSDAPADSSGATGVFTGGTDSRMVLFGAGALTSYAPE